MRTPSTKKGRGTSGGEGVSRRALFSPSLGEGTLASRVVLGEGAGGPDGGGCSREWVRVGAPRRRPGK